MKKTIYILLFLGIVYSNAFSQDSTWFKIITHEVGLDSARGTRIMLADINGDKYPDLIWGTGNLNKNTIGVFLNIPNPDENSKYKRIFTDFTAASNINQNRDAGKTGRIVDVAALADVDNDGDVDLVTSIYYHRLQMYQGANDPGDRSEVLLNDGHGHFSIKENSGLNNLVLVDTLPVGLVNCTGLSFLDYDYDGKIDLYMSTWFSDYARNTSHVDYLNKFIMPDALLKGNGDGTFTLQEHSGIETVVQPEYGVNITDWDNDGWQDIITSPYCRSGGSLFRNNRNGTFSDVASQVNYSAQLKQGDGGQNLCQWEALPGDFDNDGDMDLLQVNVHGGNQEGEGRTHLTINKGASNNYKFEWDLSRLKRIAPTTSTHFGDDGGTWMDVNGDGKLDVLIGQIGYNDAASGTNMQGQTKVYCLLQNQDGYFDDITSKLGFNKTLKNGHSIEPCDYDLDGIQDFFVSHQYIDTTIVDGQQVINNYMQIELLQNNIAKDSNHITISLDPPATCNKSAIGSRIYVYSDGKAQIREVQAGLGHFGCQQSFIQNFGLGKEQIDSIVVRWPNSSQQLYKFRNPPINSYMKLGPQGFSCYLDLNSEFTSLIAFAPSHITTDTINVNEKQTIEFLIWNFGTIPISVSDISIISDDDVFTVESEKSFNVGFTEFKSVQIGFTPKARKTYEAKVCIKSNANNEHVSYVKIRGIGFEPKPMIEVSVDTINFANTWIDSTRTVKFKIKNIGEQDLTFTDFKFSDNFNNVLTFSNAPTTIKANSSQEVTLQFVPKEIIDYKTNLIISSNAYNYPNISIPVNALCDGPNPLISLNANSLSFLSIEIGKEKERILDISNLGNSDLEISEVKLDSLENLFIFDNSVAPLLIKKDSTYSISVKFKPVDDLKHQTRMLITSNDKLTPTSIVNLTGKGKIPAGIDDCIDCASYSFIVDVVPNPAKDNVRLNFKNVKNINNHIYINIFDLSGKIVHSYNLNPSESENFDLGLELPKLSNGMYYLQIHIGFAIETIPLQIQF